MRKTPFNEEKFKDRRQDAGELGPDEAVEQSLSEKQATAIAGEIYRSLVAQHEDNPSRMSLGMFLMDQARHKPQDVRVTMLGTDREKTRQMVQKMLKGSDERMRKFTDDYLTDKGLRLDEPSMKMVLARVPRAAIEAQQHIRKLAGGDYRPDPIARRFPALEMPKPLKPNLAVVKSASTPNEDRGRKTKSVSEAEILRAMHQAIKFFDSRGYLMWTRAEAEKELPILLHASRCIYRSVFAKPDITKHLPPKQGRRGSVNYNRNNELAEFRQFFVSANMRK